MSAKPYTEAGDLFGLGATLYESLTGVHPLAGSNLPETIAKTLRCSVRPPREYVPDLPGELEEMVMAMLATEPTDRPTAADLAEQLARQAAEQGLRWSADVLPEG